MKLALLLFAQKQINSLTKGKAKGKEKAEAMKVADGEDGAEGKRSERAEEMLARKDERKQIQEEYRASGEKQKGKKPWWKFWER